MQHYAHLSRMQGGQSAVLQGPLPKILCTGRYDRRRRQALGEHVDVIEVGSVEDDIAADVGHLQETHRRNQRLPTHVMKRLGERGVERVEGTVGK